MFAAVVLAASGAGCSERCEAPLSPDAERVQRLTDLLASVPEGEHLARVVPTPVCFHAGPSQLVDGHGPRLDASADDATLAARLGHLAYHGHHRTESGSDCAAYASDMRLGEQTAHAIEAQIAGKLGAPRPPAPDLDAYERSYLEACTRGRPSK